ncbi:unnamed protein product [Paramecium octaurelia]|uniref:Uncharacterized protein n=1 Tax=Paramecium octaurelia TaxID=43137 RepID=A0A8S1W8P5_PAROT|nr:unnamed protein product [Paramecium octaurelia]
MGASCSKAKKFQRMANQPHSLDKFNDPNENQQGEAPNKQEQNPILECDCFIWDLHKLRWVKKKYSKIFTNGNRIKTVVIFEIRRIEQFRINKTSVMARKIVLPWAQGRKMDSCLEGGNSKGCRRMVLEQWRKTWFMDRYNEELLDVDIIRQFMSKAQIYEVGEYMNKIRQGKWKYLYESKEIGGGYYEEGSDSIKIGKWIELNDNYQKFSQVSYYGEYKNGKKVGLWDIFYKSQFQKRMQMFKVQKFSGGGSYDERGIKVGKWIELSDGFYEYSQVTYIGEYHNGKKVGRWCIYQWDFYTNNNQQIGGGSYDQECDGIKNGKWIELSDGFCRDSQVTYIGLYKFGKKVGKWDIWYAERERNQIKNELIGGGSYNERGQEIKIGYWIEQSDGYFDRSQVTYNGEYINGKRVGKWDIFVKNRRIGSDEKIGGGQYDQKGSGIKTGRWVELSDDYHDCSQVTYVGVYQNGKKVGRWDILYKNRDTNINEFIGGGSYNELDNGYKIGTWIELNEWFSDSSQVTNNGEYKNGLRFGRWDIWYKNRDTKQYELIGGGSYQDEVDKIKMGIWIELNDGFWDYSQVTQHGEYQNGKKVGRWDFKYEGSLLQQFQDILAAVVFIMKKVMASRLGNGLNQAMDFRCFSKWLILENIEVVRKLVLGSQLEENGIRSNL